MNANVIARSPKLSRRLVQGWTDAAVPRMARSGRFFGVGLNGSLCNFISFIGLASRWLGYDEVGTG